MARDAGITEMVAYFDRCATQQPDWERMTSEERFATLKKAERESIKQQFVLCVNDFSYASRNYFWITNKRREDQLFALWESQWLVLQKYYELKRAGKPQKILIIKARQLGASLLIEAMIAWRTMFFPNTEALVVSVDADHSKYLFSLMLHIYDMMPWWLKPQAASLQYEDGLHFDNPDRDARRLKPGLNSHIYVQHSNQISGVGQGHVITAFHGSEVTDWLQSRAEQIIEGDLLNAIAETTESFGFLESTGKGAGTYSHKLWQTCEQMGDRAEWCPLFLPWFFETTRVLAPPQGWHIQKPEDSMCERVSGEWAHCDKCTRFFSAAIHGESCVGTLCPICKSGTVQPFVLTDAQLYWKQTKRENAEFKGLEALKKHRAEMSSTAEEAFQLSGVCVFDEECIEKATYSIRNPKKVAGIKVGFLNSRGEFHGYTGVKGGCWRNGCTADHRFDDEVLTVWEEPQKGREYAVGVDISEGIGQDYSVISIIKTGRSAGPDEQVAIWRSNGVDPSTLSFYVNVLGLWYNEALMCIEYNTGFRTTANEVRFKYMYPNIFRWKHLDSQNPVSSKFHWYTQYNTKPLLWQTWRKWIKAGLMIVRDPVTLAEMLTFQKDDEDDRSAEHERGSHDDVLMASMIALYCSHEMEADEGGRIPVPTQAESEEPFRYRMTCLKCKTVWGAANPEKEYRCPNEACQSIRITGEPTTTADPRKTNLDEAFEWMSAQRDNEKPAEVEFGVL